MEIAQSEESERTRYGGELTANELTIRDNQSTIGWPTMRRKDDQTQKGKTNKERKAYYSTHESGKGLLMCNRQQAGL